MRRLPCAPSSMAGPPRAPPTLTPSPSPAIGRGESGTPSHAPLRSPTTCADARPRKTICQPAMHRTMIHRAMIQLWGGSPLWRRELDCAPLGDETMAAETSTTEAVPKYFADFMRINAEQHGELGQRIIQVENRLLWKLIGFRPGHRGRGHSLHRSAAGIEVGALRWAWQARPTPIHPHPDPLPPERPLRNPVAHPRPRPIHPHPSLPPSRGEGINKPRTASPLTVVQRSPQGRGDNTAREMLRLRSARRACLAPTPTGSPSSWPSLLKRPLHNPVAHPRPRRFTPILAFSHQGGRDK